VGLCRRHSPHHPLTGMEPWAGRAHLFGCGPPRTPRAPPGAGREPQRRAGAFLFCSALPPGRWHVSRPPWRSARPVS
jgi:hypothetical protein